MKNYAIFTVISAFLAIGFSNVEARSPIPLLTEENVCALTHCRSGFRCVPEVVQCIRSPCPAIAKCVEIEGANPETVDPCANKRCQSGYKCETQIVTCVRAPCPPIGTCVRIQSTKPEEVDPCANKRCRSGYKCEPEVVSCFRPPCPPLGKCVAA